MFILHGLEKGFLKINKDENKILTLDMIPHILTPFGIRFSDILTSNHHIVLKSKTRVNAVSIPATARNLPKKRKNPSRDFDDLGFWEEASSRT